MRFTIFVMLVSALVLQFAFAHSAEQLPELALYDVSDLVHPIVDSDADSSPNQGWGTESPGAPSKYWVDGGNNNRITCATLQEMIKIRIRPASWDPATGTSIEERGGMLVIMQTAEVQQLIASLLSTIREQCRPQVVVKSLLVPSTSVPQDTIFSSEKMAKLLGPTGTAGALAAPRVVCFNGQRVQVKCARETGFIHAYEASGDMLDPVTRNLIEGCIFDVRPTLSHDRRTVTIELRLSLSSAANMTESRKILFGLPAARFVVPAKKAAPGSSFFPIDTPSVQVSSVHTNVRVSAGSWILAGTVPNPNTEAKEKHLLVLIAAEALGSGVAATPFKPLAAKDKIEAPHPPKNIPARIPAEAAPPELRIFDIRDISSAITDFPALNLNHLSSGKLADPANEPSAPGLQDVDITTLIKERALAGNFTDPEMTIDVSAGQLIVFQRPLVHAAIAKILELFRRMILPQIVIKAHLVSSAGIPNETYFDDDGMNAILNAEGNTFSATFRSVCFNRQQTHARNGRVVSYVSDYDASASTYAPVVRSAFDGTIFETRPIVTGDRTAIHLDLRLAHTTDVTKTKRTLGLQDGAPNAAGPLLSGATSQATGADSVQPIAAIELDTLAQNISTIQTQIVVPKGKWVLAAVLSSGNPKGPKNLLLFVTAEALETP